MPGCSGIVVLCLFFVANGGVDQGTQSWLNRHKHKPTGQSNKLARGGAITGWEQAHSQSETGGETSTCSNGNKDSDESDVDCGGSCKGCAAGFQCFVGHDCHSGVCEESKCAAATPSPSVTPTGVPTNLPSVVALTMASTIAVPTPAPRGWFCSNNLALCNLCEKGRDQCCLSFIQTAGRCATCGGIYCKGVALPKIAGTSAPSVCPTVSPTAVPTTGYPTATPTLIPTPLPTVATQVPSPAPSAAPTLQPSTAPTSHPTFPQCYSCTAGQQGVCESVTLLPGGKRACTGVARSRNPSDRVECPDSFRSCKQDKTVHKTAALTRVAVPTFQDLCLRHKVGQLHGILSGNARSLLTLDTCLKKNTGTHCQTRYNITKLNYQTESNLPRTEKRGHNRKLGFSELVTGSLTFLITHRLTGLFPHPSRAPTFSCRDVV
jgi:hypothetical protein